ncbi:PKD domain-containing protein [Pedobacter heparinus]|uniref:PKD domain-containing protein n=1 Tax=Pedobacter heparinus TaxID=984 RepID=UPI0029304375|nr:PKD domain-containing protein [Pedobacter heparinus]
MKKLLHLISLFTGIISLQITTPDNLCAQVKQSGAAQTVQPAIVPADTVPAIINHKIENGVVNFSAVLRPLRQIAGAPAPFYTYFWEFGDGQFSFETEPLHSYPDTLRYDVRLFATNSYDDGKRPPTRPKPIKPGASRPILAASQQKPSSFFKSGGAIELKTNCMPKPGDDMMLVFGYRNKAENGLSNLSGTVSILYNDKEFNKDNFELAETRTYNQEKKTSLEKQGAITARKVNTEYPFYASLNGPVYGESAVVADPEGSAVIKEKMAAYRKNESWKFENLKAGEEKFLFMQFKTTPEMIKDTNAVVKLTGMFIPDNPLAVTEFFTVELQIVASHDPNKMMLRNSRMNFRFTGKNKKLSYKVRFQNTGKGPAKKIDVGVAIAAVLNKGSVEIIDSKPKLTGCNTAYANQSCLDTLSTADSLHFIFKNIYLPGLQQKGVKDADSTMGFIEYKIGFKEKPKKLPFKSGAAIVFDKNEPIYTNRATGKYKMGLSPGIIAGYGFPFKNGNTPFSGQNNISLGVSLAPYAPHRYYWQVELYGSTYAEKEYLVNRSPGNDRLVPVVIDGKQQEARLKHIDSTARIKVITINIVPAQLRYNFNKYIGAGIGTLVSFNINEQATPGKTAVYELLTAVGTGQEGSIKKSFSKVSKSFNDFQNTLFADIQLGKVHVGPSIGFRYLYTLQGSDNRLITYLTWKF